MRNYNRRGRNNNGGCNVNRNNNSNNNGQKTFNPLRSQFDSNGPAGKIRGTAQQIVDKYTTMADECRTSGDRVKAEELLQHAEHYAHMIVQYNIDNPVVEKEQRAETNNSTSDNESSDANGGEEDAPRQNYAKKSRGKKSPAQRHHRDTQDARTDIKVDSEADSDNSESTQSLDSEKGSNSEKPNVRKSRNSNASNARNPRDAQSSRVEKPADTDTTPVKKPRKTTPRKPREIKASDADKSTDRQPASSDAIAEGKSEEA